MFLNMCVLLAELGTEPGAKTRVKFCGTMQFLPTEVVKVGIGWEKGEDVDVRSDPRKIDVWMALVNILRGFPGTSDQFPFGKQDLTALLKDHMAWVRLFVLLPIRPFSNGCNLPNNICAQGPYGRGIYPSSTI